MKRALTVVAGGLVLALAAACSSGESIAEPPRSLSTSSIPAQSSPAPTPTPTPSSTPAPAKVTPARLSGDTVPLSAFPILASPCKYLRRAGFLEAKGTQTWRAVQSTKTPRSADWAKFALFPDLAKSATHGSQCVATASAQRGIVLSVFVFKTSVEAGQQLSPTRTGLAWATRPTSARPMSAARGSSASAG